MQPVSAGFVVRLNYDDRGSANAKGDWQIENNQKKIWKDPSAYGKFKCDSISKRPTVPWVTVRKQAGYMRKKGETPTLLSLYKF